MTGISRHPIESFRLDRFADNGVGAEAQIHERSDP